MAEALLLRIGEVVELLHMSRSKVYQLVADGTLPSVLIGKSRRVVRRQLEDWVNGLGAAGVEDDEEW